MTFLPDTPPGEFIINRIHRLPKPPHLLENIPKDTIVHTHFYHVKENLMCATQNPAAYPQPYISLSFYAVLSNYIMLQRKNLSTITKPIMQSSNPLQMGISGEAGSCEERQILLHLHPGKRPLIAQTIEHPGTTRAKTSPPQSQKQ